MLCKRVADLLAVQPPEPQLAIETVGNNLVLGGFEGNAHYTSIVPFIQVVEKILNHISGSVSGVAAMYNRYSYFDEMKEAFERFDKFRAKLIED